MAQNVLGLHSTRRSATALFATGSLLTLGVGASAGALGAALLANPAAAASFTVATTNDSGAGSLRQAIIDANASAGTDTITFAAGIAGTITLASDLPTVSDGLTITGPGSAALAITGSDTFHVFEIATGGNGAVTITGLTITNSLQSNAQQLLGREGGGAINVVDTAFTLNDVHLRDNVVDTGDSEQEGGGIAVTNATGTGDIVVSNSVFDGNSVHQDVNVSSRGGRRIFRSR
ncbi:MAG: hypothetical protein WEA11_06565 [Acidimicrobiales bacterium]